HGTPPDLKRSRAVRLVRRGVPMTGGLVGGGGFARGGGPGGATPLPRGARAVLAPGIVFALDSLPARFCVTPSRHPVLTTNAFAVLARAALYFMLTGLRDRLVHLPYGLAFLLAFIGVKLVLHYLHGLWPVLPEIPLPLSLAVIVAVLATTTVTSLRATRSRPP